MTPVLLAAIRKELDTRLDRSERHENVAMAATLAAGEDDRGTGFKSMKSMEISDE